MRDDELEWHAERLDFSEVEGKTLFNKVVGIDTRFGIKSAENMVLLAVEQCGIDAAMALFESVDAELVLRRMHVVEYLFAESIPIVDLKELAALASLAESHLDANSVPLTKLGLPSRSFARCPWLCTRLNRLYYTKKPHTNQLTVASMILSAGDDIYSDQDFTQMIKLPNGDIQYDYMWTIDSEDHGRPNESTTQRSQGKAKPTGTSNYASASILPFLSEKEADRITALRPKLLEVKLEVLRALCSLDRKSDQEDPWNQCLPIFEKHLSHEDAFFLLELDRKYQTTRLFLDPRMTYASNRSHYEHCGGISDLTECIGHYVRESTTSPMAILRFDINSIPEIRNRLVNTGRLTPYVQTFRTESHDAYALALDAYVLRQENEARFWSNFRSRVCADLNSELSKTLIVSLTVKAKFLGTALADIQTLAKSMTWSSTPGGSNSKEKVVDSSPGASFRSMNELTWEEITICVESRDTLTISAREEVEELHWSQLEFRDRRKTEAEPNLQWKLLLDLAAHSGQLLNNVDSQRRSRLCKILRNLFGINENCFRDYSKSARYRARFNIDQKYH